MMSFARGLRVITRTRCLLHIKRHFGDDIRVRFAPSPTGQLHLGGLRTALLNYLFAKSHGGKFILRIENTDQTRIVPGAVEKLSSILEWVGIEIDEGPTQGGEFGPYVQSERLSMYQDATDTLLQKGAAYKCFCSSRRLELLRREAAKRGEVPKYDNRCRHLTEDECSQNMSEKKPHVVRLKLEHMEEPWQDLVYGPIHYDVAANEGDPILMKTDGFPTYHLANVVDDHCMKVSHVLRGVEWQVSTAKHVLLYRAFGWSPPQFAHLPLLLNKDGKKLSKRQNDVHVESYKDLGYMSESVLSLLTSTGAGFTVRNPSKFTLPQLIQHFDLKKVSTHSSRVDFERLPEINRCHLQEKLRDPDEREKLRIELRDLLTHPGARCSINGQVEDDYLDRILDWSVERITMVTDLQNPKFDFLWHAPSKEDLIGLHGNQDASNRISTTLTTVADLPDDNVKETVVLDALKCCCKVNGWKFGHYMKTLRTALSGLKEGPSIAEMISILGKSTTISRLQIALNYINSH